MIRNLMLIGCLMSVPLPGQALEPPPGPAPTWERSRVLEEGGGLVREGRDEGGVPVRLLLAWGAEPGGGWGLDLLLHGPRILRVDRRIGARRAQLRAVAGREGLSLEVERRPGGLRIEAWLRTREGWKKVDPGAVPGELARRPDFQDLLAIWAREAASSFLGLLKEVEVLSDGKHCDTWAGRECYVTCAQGCAEECSELGIHWWMVPLRGWCLWSCNLGCSVSCGCGIRGFREAEPRGGGGGW